MFFWHWIIVQWIKRTRIYFAVLRMWIPTNFLSSILPSAVHFWYIFPHRHGCYAFSEQIVYSQHKIIISQQQPSIGPNWIHFKLVRSVFFRCSCSIGMQHPKHVPDHPCKLIFSFSFFFKNQKAKGRHLTPTVSLVRMLRVVTWHIRAGEEQRVWKLRQISHPAVGSDDIPTDHFYHQKMLSIFICTFSQYTFAYYINFSTFVI